jgi:hypothetical protein
LRVYICDRPQLDLILLYFLSVHTITTSLNIWKHFVWKLVFLRLSSPSLISVLLRLMNTLSVRFERLNAFESLSFISWWFLNWLLYGVIAAIIVRIFR